MEAAATVKAPRIKESFLSLECKHELDIDLSKGGKTVLIIGKVLHMAAAEEFAKGFDSKYSEKGFMYNIHAPKNLLTGEGEKSALASLHILKSFK